MAQSFVKTINRDYLAFLSKPDAAAAAHNRGIAFENYNEKLRYRSPRE